MNKKGNDFFSYFFLSIEKRMAKSEYQKTEKFRLDYKPQCRLRTFTIW